MLGMTFPFCSDVVITHLVNLQFHFFSCIFNFRIVCIIPCHIAVATHVLPMEAIFSKEATYLLVLLFITYDHTHLELDLHPAKTMQCTQRS